MSGYDPEHVKAAAEFRRKLLDAIALRGIRPTVDVDNEVFWHARSVNGGYGRIDLRLNIDMQAQVAPIKRSSKFMKVSVQAPGCRARTFTQQKHPLDIPKIARAVGEMYHQSHAWGESRKRERQQHEFLKAAAKTLTKTLQLEESGVFLDTGLGSKDIEVVAPRVTFTNVEECADHAAALAYALANVKECAAMWRGALKRKAG